MVMVMVMVVVVVVVVMVTAMEVLRFGVAESKRRYMKFSEK